MRILLIILALLLESLSLSYPLEADAWDANPDDLHKRQQRSPENCADPNQNPSADCWTTLGADQYLQVWIANNSASCNDGDFPGDGFASCYQQKVGRGELLGLQCDQVQIQSCRPPGNFSSYTPQRILRPLQHLWHLAILQFHLLCLRFCQRHRVRPRGCHRFRLQPHRERYCR